MCRAGLGCFADLPSRHDLRSGIEEREQSLQACVENQVLKDAIHSMNPAHTQVQPDRSAGPNGTSAHDHHRPFLRAE